MRHNRVQYSSKWFNIVQMLNSTAGALNNSEQRTALLNHFSFIP